MTSLQGLKLSHEGFRYFLINYIDIYLSKRIFVLYR